MAPTPTKQILTSYCRYFDIEGMAIHQSSDISEMMKGCQTFYLH
jgi:hypothetical protein